MTADQLIESYVSDVVRRLPRRQRGDVAAELRALLREELAGRLTDRGAGPGDATPADAVTLLAGFGHPAEVAARYRPTFNIIDPSDSRAFLKAAVIGVALIWLVGLVEAFGGRLGSIDDALLALQRFYFGLALPSLVWPGALVVWFAVAAWARRRWPRTAIWKPRAEERDRINRFGLASAIVFWAAGTAALVNPAGALNLISGNRIPAAAMAALAYDDDFVRLRGPVVLVVITALLVLVTSVLIRGRWEPTTRRAQVVLNVVAVVVLLWAILGGSTFREPGPDQAVKAALAITVLAILVDLALRLRRHRLAAATPRLP
jgi:hypothetical protein